LDVTLSELGGWSAILAKLSARRSLEPEEAYAAMTGILTGQAEPSQIGAFLIGLRSKGETAEEIAAFARAMLACAEPLEVTGSAVDTCGTGGDGAGTLNVSTLAAFVVAGAGVRVVKHGNRAASSRAGSADVLAELGVVIDLDPSSVAACVEECGMGFCFAPRFHPAMRHAGPVRAALGVPTVFNFLGPLVNPARVPYQVVGVGDPTMAPKMAMVLRANGTQRSMVVYGSDGLDELTVTAPSTVIEVASGEAHSKVFDIDAMDHGIARASLEELSGGDAARNAAIAREVLGGKRGPYRDIVVFNAAAALVVTGRAGGFEEGISQACASIDSGAAEAVLEKLRVLSQELGSKVAR
jgi:anthranilate phosphoribosyltransferase